MISETLVSSFHDKPRTTNDIDIVIEANEKKRMSFVKSLVEGYYVSEEAPRKAFFSTTTFNIIDLTSGYKAEIIIRKKRAFSLCLFFLHCLVG